MRKTLLILAFVFSIFEAFSSTPIDLFEKANKHYQQNEFNEAIALYDSLCAEGYNHAETFYNLGNAHFRKGNLGYAILNYEKALKLNPKDEDALHNLQMANKKVVDEFNILPTSALSRIFKDFSSLFSAGVWSIIALVFFTIVLITTFVFLFINRHGALLVVLVVSLALGLMLEGVAYGKRQLELQAHAILTVANSYVKSAPADGAEDLFILHEGTKVLVLDGYKNWNKIKLPDGKIGWINSDGISVI